MPLLCSLTGWSGAICNYRRRAGFDILAAGSAPCPSDTQGIWPASWSRFTKGHEKDLICSGASLAEILKAGQWRSLAFLVYLDLKSLERDAVLVACVDGPVGDEEEACTIGTNPLPPIRPPFDHFVAEDSPGALLGFGESDEELSSSS